MINLLKTLHYEMFKNNEEEKRLRNIHDFEEETCPKCNEPTRLNSHNVRNDEKISSCMKISNLLKRLEEEVYSNIKNS